MNTAVVATSINPYARLPHQLRCFQQWEQLGFKPISFNIANEAHDLIASGVDPGLIETIEEGESGEQLFGGIL